MTVRRLLSTLLALSVGSALLEAQTPPGAARSTPRLPGGTSLFQTFVRPDDGALAGLTTLDSIVRREVERRLNRRQSVISALPDPKGLTFPFDVIAEARRNHESAIIGLLGPSVAREAVEFASRVPLSYEWEGYADPPLAEAAFAVAYMDAHPSTPLTPYLNLFRLHRYRSAFEAATWEAAHPPYGADATRGMAWVDSQRLLQREAATKYLAVLEQLQRDTDVVVHAMALDLNARDFVYLETRPRVEIADIIK